MLISRNACRGALARVQLLIVLGIAAVLLIMLGGLLITAVDRVRQRSARSAEEMRFWQLSKGIHNHCSSSNGGVFLPAAYRSKNEGDPPFSWRVAVLPFMEQSPLFDRYNFAEPWD